MWLFLIYDIILGWWTESACSNYNAKVYFSQNYWLYNIVNLLIP